MSSLSEPINWDLPCRAQVVACPGAASYATGYFRRPWLDDEMQPSNDWYMQATFRAADRRYNGTSLAWTGLLQVWLTPLLWIEVHGEDVRCAEEVPARVQA